MPALVPVVLLTGFLGSGKTTLLNRLLEVRRATPSEDGSKLAILVNELGAVGIDASLLPPGAARQVELPGGCICCTLDENLEQTLNEILSAEPDLGMVIIETTGIAEPLPIIWTLTGQGLGSRIRLAAVVSVVDAHEHERHRPLAPAVDAQVEHADILVVSKLDTFAAGERAERLAALEQVVRQKNPHAPILAEPDPDRAAAALLHLLADPQTAAQLHRADYPGPRAEERPHAHGHGFDSVAVQIHGTLDFEELTSQLEELPASYVRIKGVAWAVDRETGSDEPTLIAFHRVGARVSAEPLMRPGRASDGSAAPGAAPDTSSGSPLAPRAVALGFGVDESRLAACVRAAMLPCED